MMTRPPPQPPSATPVCPAREGAEDAAQLAPAMPPAEWIGYEAAMPWFHPRTRPDRSAVDGATMLARADEGVLEVDSRLTVG